MVSKLLRHMKNYSSDITDSQWVLLQVILRDNRKRKYSLRDILNCCNLLLNRPFFFNSGDVCVGAFFRNSFIPSSGTSNLESLGLPPVISVFYHHL
jgi:hypothetical protein